MSQLPQSRFTNFLFACCSEICTPKPRCSRCTNALFQEHAQQSCLCVKLHRGISDGRVASVPQKNRQDVTCTHGSVPDHRDHDRVFSCFLQRDTESLPSCCNTRAKLSSTTATPQTMLAAEDCALGVCVQQILLKLASQSLLGLARVLHREREYSLALTACQTCFDLLAAESTSQGTSASLDDLTAQTKICAAKNDAALLAAEDPELTLPDSVLRLVNALSSLQSAMQSMLPCEQNHWLVYEGAIAIKQICTAFRSLPGRDMMQFLAFTVLAMDTDLTFSLPEHLPLRIDVYLALAQCQQTAGLRTEAVATVQKGLAAVASVEMLEKLDPLPPSSEAQAAYAHAKTRLNTAQFGYTASTLPSEQAVKDALQAMLTSDSERIAALAGSLLPTAPNRVVKHQQWPCKYGQTRDSGRIHGQATPHTVEHACQQARSSFTTGSGSRCSCFHGYSPGINVFFVNESTALQSLFVHAGAIV